MAIFCDELGADIIQDCTNRPTAHLEQRVLIIPSSLLPASGISYDSSTPDSLITDITLASGTGYLIEGIQQKTWINHNNTFQNAADATPGMIHMLENIHILDPSVEIRDEINNLAFGGGTCFAIVERKWKGTDSGDAFLFFGAKFGLSIPDGGLVDSSGENDGKIVISLQTPEGFKEPNLPHVFLETDYATTRTAVWTNKLAAA